MRMAGVLQEAAILGVPTPQTPRLMLGYKREREWVAPASMQLTVHKGKQTSN